MPLSLLLPRPALEAVGGYDVSMRKGYKDCEFNSRLGARGFFAHVVPYIMLLYRFKITSMQITEFSPLRGDSWGQIQKKILGYIGCAD